MHCTTIAVESLSDRVIVRLNRPDVRNAIDRQMVDELTSICVELEKSPKAMILFGGEGYFASGADISQLKDRRRDDALAGINSGLFGRIARLPMPVVAALNGFALGAGAELAYAADFRMATPTLKIGNPETGLGILAAAGATWRLRELVGEGLAKDMLLCGRVLDADEALAARLITELHDGGALEEAAHALVDRIARQDPLAVMMTKKVFHMPPGAHPLVDDLAQAILFESDAKVERMQAFLDRKSK